jgi:hypothetical protein
MRILLLPKGDFLKNKKNAHYNRWRLKATDGMKNLIIGKTWIKLIYMISLIVNT